MDSVNEARHSSLLETKTFINSKTSVWTGDTPFEDDHTVFKNYLDIIEANKQKHVAILIGFTLDKSKKADLLIKDLLFIMPAIRTWASRPAVNRPDIKGKASLAESRIKKLADTILLATAANIKTILDDNASITGPLYVSTARKNIFFQNILNFEAVIEMPKSLIDERAAATRTMYDTIAQAMKFRKETFLDTTKRFRESEADFYLSFRQTMKLDNNPSRKLPLRGNIKDGNNNPVAGVLCQVIELDKKAKSGAKGNFLFKSMPAGEYTIIFTKFGYEPAQRMFAVNDGERTELSIKMTEKVFPA